ncbi:MAG: translational GTPase TypA [Chloroflexi bacterium]|nr:translational GTPase TypA [Chloroflexota bacterium]
MRNNSVACPTKSTRIGGHSRTRASRIGNPAREGHGVARHFRYKQGVPSTRGDVRNVAVIAHVDHGKTSLVDQMLRQAGLARTRMGEPEFTLDSMTGNPLEREKGITILSKLTGIPYHDHRTGQAVRLNIIDTPGHADFGGEVERVLGMADGALLIVDAAEGPMPQTRFVLQKTFELGLRPIVVINKVDRRDARADWVLEATSDLFLDLATDAVQLEFPVLYAIAREGRAGLRPDDLAADLQPLFDTILDHVPPPVGESSAPLQLQITTLDYDTHQGRFAIGRIKRGAVRPGDQVVRLTLGEPPLGPLKVVAVYTYEGLARVAIDSATFGDIVAVTGIADVAIGDTLADPARPEPLPAQAIEQPTVRMTFSVNTSPFAGREARVSSTSRQLRARLLRELETNVSLRVEDTDSADEFLVSGRGELHLAILVETLRREGYEFQVSRPEVITRELDGRLCEPVEHLVVDTIEEHLGAVAELLGKRLGKLEHMAHDGHGGVRMEFRVPTRGLIGLRSQLLTATRGHSVMASRLLGYEPWQGPISGTRNGVLVASETGVATGYAIASSQERAQTMVEPQTAVYEGMLVGLNSRPDDMAVNITREKKQTNIRSSTSEIAVKLSPPLRLSLEQALDFIEPDELVEVTPVTFRLRKRLLNANDRAKERKRAPS